MAIASSSVSKRKCSSDQKGKIRNVDKTKEDKSRKQSDDGCDFPAKRSKCPGVRVVGSRIYDSENGKTCHQCRQKTMDFVASCKNPKNGKSCTINFCHKCLVNRYGEKAEEVANLEGWNCPKCRGICNCSFCMKKRGHQPTGILVHTAKATGFSSVSELLDVQGSEDLGVNKIVKAEPKRHGKENSFSGNCNSNSSSITVLSSPNKRKRKNQKGLKEMENGNNDERILAVETSYVKPPISNERLKKTLDSKLSDDVFSKRGSKGVKKDKQCEILLKTTKTKNPLTCEKVFTMIQDSMDHNGVLMKEGKISGDVSVPENEIFLKKTKTKNRPISEKVFTEIKGNMEHNGILPKEVKISGDVNVPENGIVLKTTKTKKTPIAEKVFTEIQDNMEHNGILPKEVKISGDVNVPENGNVLKTTKTKNPPIAEKVFTNIQDSMERNGVLTKEVKISGDVSVPEKEKNDVSGSKGVSLKLLECKKNKKQRDSRPYKAKTDAMKLQDRDIEVDIPLPQGAELTTVAGIDLPAGDIGCALQFLEFCTTFKEILDLKEGDPALVLGELMHGRLGRRGKPSIVVQFHIQLLSLIQEDLGEDSEAITHRSGKNSWLHALQKCATKSQPVLRKLKLDSLGQKADDYNSLDSSQRLVLLVFLCDEVLCTAHIRSWIDDQNFKTVQKLKETKERIFAGKKKEKQLKQKMLDEVAKTIMGKNGAPLSISEHEAVVSQIKAEVAQAHTEIMESQNMVPNDIKRCAAVRTGPILLDINGHTYWRLNGYSEDSNLLLQDVGTWDDVESGEKWFTFDVEQEKQIDKYVSSRRKRKLQSQKVPDLPSSKNLAQTDLVV